MIFFKKIRFPNIPFFDATPNQKLVTIISNFILRVSVLVVILSVITLLWGDKWFSESASLSAQTLTASLAVIIATAAFLISISIQSPSYQKEIRTLDQLKSLQNYLINLYHREFNRTKMEEKISAEGRMYREGYNTSNWNYVGEESDDNPFNFRSYLDTSSLEPSERSSFHPLLKINLINNELDYIFNFITGDIGEFFYLRSNKDLGFNEINDNLWKDGYPLLCLIGTGKFHLRIVEDLLYLISTLTNEEIDEIFRLMTDSRNRDTYVDLPSSAQFITRDFCRYASFKFTRR